MYKLYKITTIKDFGVYYGITKYSLNIRFNQHKFVSKSGKSYIANAMRKYGANSFSIHLVNTFNTLEECCKAEQEIIATSTEKLYNLASGGQTGYSMSKDPRCNSWKSKLKEQRQGRKPALGMKHSEENKKIFSTSIKKRWDKCGRYPKEVIQCGFTEANKKYGISKTHYYRMRHLHSEQV